MAHIAFTDCLPLFSHPVNLACYPLHFLVYSHAFSTPFLLASLVPRALYFLWSWTCGAFALKAQQVTVDSVFALLLEVLKEHGVCVPTYTY